MDIAMVSVKFEFEQIGATWDFCYSFNFKLNKVSKNN